MQRKHIIVTTASSLLLVGAVFAQVNVGSRHVDLRAAQRDISAALADLGRAQQANDWDMSGHAAHAKQLLEQADQEIKAAAVSANHR